MKKPLSELKPGFHSDFDDYFDESSGSYLIIDDDTVDGGIMCFYGDGCDGIPIEAIIEFVNLLDKHGFETKINK